MTRTEHLLWLIAEECAEVAQRASKAARFGLQGVQPNQALTNAQRLDLELTDLFAVVELLEDQEGLNLIGDIMAMDAKKQKVEHFLRYSMECGTLDSTTVKEAKDGTGPP